MFSPNRQSLCPLYAANKDSRGKDLQGTVVNKKEEVDSEGEKEQTAFDKVASFGLAGILAIATAEAIFWALGVPLVSVSCPVWGYLPLLTLFSQWQAAIYYKVTTGEWIDMMTTDGQLKAAGFSFGYGGNILLSLQH